MCWLTSKECCAGSLHVKKEETIYYPCIVCKNGVIFNDREVNHEHLFQSPLMDNYFIWTKHGKTQPWI
jgi:hypothetical protein